jgi:hypothetical protein
MAGRARRYAHRDRSTALALLLASRGADRGRDIEAEHLQRPRRAQIAHSDCNGKIDKPEYIPFDGRAARAAGTYPTVMIPAFAVPSSILFHALSLRQLMRQKSE